MALSFAGVADSVRAFYVLSRQEVNQVVSGHAEGNLMTLNSSLRKLTMLKRYVRCRYHPP